MKGVSAIPSVAIIPSLLFLWRVKMHRLVCASEKERTSTPRLQFRLLYSVHRDCRYVPMYDPCNGYYIEAYLNDPEVQEALHVRMTKWAKAACKSFLKCGETILGPQVLKRPIPWLRRGSAVPMFPPLLPLRSPMTLFGFKEQHDLDAEHVSKDVGPFFRDKEKVLITCSRHIIYRYRHLMQNVVSLLPHAKKDRKVEYKESKGSTLNELVELRSCSSFLFFEAGTGLAKLLLRCQDRQKHQ